MANATLRYQEFRSMANATLRYQEFRRMKFLPYFPYSPYSPTPLLPLLPTPCPLPPAFITTGYFFIWKSLKAMVNCGGI